MLIDGFSLLFDAQGFMSELEIDGLDLCQLNQTLWQVPLRITRQ